MILVTCQWSYSVLENFLRYNLACKLIAFNSWFSYILVFTCIKYVPLTNYVMSYYAGKSVESVPNIYILLILDPPT